MKVVINKCFGGFSLSMAGDEKYLNLIGKKAYFYKQTKHEFKDGVEEYKKIKPNEENAGMFTYCFTKDLGEIIDKKTLNENYEKYHFYNNDLDRSDETLIKVVELLGDDANGSCAKLSIVEIPDDISYEIEEYDGNEHIAERHNTWS